ncbi:carboxylate-amine ligase [Actinacidiphila soli]|uniref:carboxylate-amine ligase n=1 Tax=Actinacidiphila soli TaxID=2487275 RepID=UPI000FC9F03D|nr:glutamate--cysteine ligase [Actinacidiphila soli]
MAVLAFGVEEEYLLLDPVSGLPVPAADAVRAAAGLESALSAAEVQPEMLQVQVEIATPVCQTLTEVGGHLLRLRHAVGAAAEKVGCRIAACGTAPLWTGTQAPLTDTPRYRQMRIDAAQLADEQLVNGMHVHVSMADRDTGVMVLNRLRPWLPILVAIGANSPMWRGRDTGFASWRTVLFDRWPVSGRPPVFRNARDYDRRADQLVDSGAIADRRQLYWQARLSKRYPTIEIRATDVQLCADDAVMLAGLIRALVDAALRSDRAGEPLLRVQPEMLHAAAWHAARHGLGGHLIAPHGAGMPAREAVGLLLDHLTPPLTATGDTQQVTAFLQRLLRDGTGAARQRQALHHAGPEGLIQLLTTQTTAP